MSSSQVRGGGSGDTGGCDPANPTTCAAGADRGFRHAHPRRRSLHSGPTRRVCAIPRSRMTISFKPAPTTTTIAFKVARGSGERCHWAAGMYADCAPRAWSDRRASSELVCVIAISIALIAGSFMLVDPFSSALSSAVRDTQGRFPIVQEAWRPRTARRSHLRRSGTQTLVQVYPHRPNGPIGTPVVEQALPSVAVTSGGKSTFGIFVDKNGTVLRTAGLHGWNDRRGTAGMYDRSDADICAWRALGEP